MMSAQSGIRLPLNRPEYVAVPEAMITALAGRLFKVPALDIPGGKPTGLYFSGSSPKSRNVAFRATSPSPEDLARFGVILSRNGLTAESDSKELAESVLNSILGIQVERSDVRPASPLTPSLALLQNMRGLMGKENPADVGEIIEAMYALGSQVTDDSTAASRWLSASKYRMEIDPLLKVLDAAIDEGILRGSVEFEHPVPMAAVALNGQFASTPFEWFVIAWNRLTSPVWVRALPARVWVDWATTILRLAFGFGFLWESAWYVSVARAVQRQSPVTQRGTQSEMGEVVPWVSTKAGYAARDVAPRLIRRIERGERLRHAFDRWSGEQENEALDFPTAIINMRNDEKFREEILRLLGNVEHSNSATNVWEAVKYALLSRDTSGQNSDYYGVFRSNGRFLTVDPGTEWIAVVASLTCDAPGGNTDVGAVMASLRMLGMKPELSDLISLLERAGLARGSADADQGVIVESAF